MSGFELLLGVPSGKAIKKFIGKDKDKEKDKPELKKDKPPTELEMMVEQQKLRRERRQQYRTMLDSDDYGIG